MWLQAENRDKKPRCGLEWWAFTHRESKTRGRKGAEMYRRPEQIFRQAHPSG